MHVSRMISASPNKENEEALPGQSVQKSANLSFGLQAVPTCIDMQNMFSKRKLFEKEAGLEVLGHHVQLSHR